MSFQAPWFLLSLVVLAGAAGVWLLAERRQPRYAVRFPNLDVLASVVPERSRLRLVPPLLFGLALFFFLAGLEVIQNRVPMRVLRRRTYG